MLPSTIPVRLWGLASRLDRNIATSLTTIPLLVPALTGVNFY